MDAPFQPAIAAIERDDLEGFRAIVRQNPTLATTRSSVGHPVLLQCLVLSGKNLVNQLDMARALIDAGAGVAEPLVACGSCDNAAAAGLLLDSGASINGTGGWSPLEESLYWNSGRMVELLVKRGAAVANLRIAAGLGRTDLVEGFFNADGSLKAGAGTINWPWGDRSWKNDRQDVVNNAFIYACMHGHIDTAEVLLGKGAQINAIPGGFDFAGTGLHYAALNGHRPMVDFLLQHGADATVRDEKIGGTAAGWAEYAKHAELSRYLKSKEA
jgi:hypothetical protein